jgi:hypothetical protein
MSLNEVSKQKAEVYLFSVLVLTPESPSTELILSSCFLIDALLVTDATNDGKEMLP